MGKPAACIGDLHSCPLTVPIVHIGGSIIGPGASSVWIGGMPAAIRGDSCICTGAIDSIITGSATVFIEGQPTARVGDSCAHGGVIVTGCGTVLIGDVLATDVLQEIIYQKRDDRNSRKPFRKPPPEKRKQLIRQAIVDGTEMLERKLKLLRKEDAKTLKSFRKWFGRDDAETRKIILTRIRKTLKVFRLLTEENFTELRDVETKRNNYAAVFPDDVSHTIMLGNPFWEAPATGPDSKASVLVHEISHFDDVDGTRDNVYGDYSCLWMARYNPNKALYNAESFERFIAA